MLKKIDFTTVAFAFLSILTFQACSMKVPLNSSDQEIEAYEKLDTQKKISVKYKSSLKDTHNVSTGVFTDSVIIEHNKKKLHANTFFKENFIKVLKAKNIPLEFNEKSKEILSLYKFEFFSSRSSGFLPIITFSQMKIKMSKDNKIFTSYIKIGTVPIWSGDEIIEPLYNEPFKLMILELVAKINKEYFNYKLNDKKVLDLLNTVKEKIDNNDSLVYLDVYELGFSNNKKVLPYLIELSSHDDEYVRISSIATLGLLGGESQFDYLVSKYILSHIWQDRGMALKAIGDIGNTQSSDFLLRERNIWSNIESKEAKWNLIILDLYL